jgi:UDP-4-amino-4,6-dideoxy-N-acetyl-beta-L-altrosamine N-acetyltransferase
MMIALRDIRPEDRDKIRSWRNLPEISQYMYTDHFITPEEHESWFQNLHKDPMRRYWIITDHQMDFGLVYLYNIDDHRRSCYWGFYIANPDGRGRGVGSFAEYSVLQYVFDKMGFNRLCCEVLVPNQSVIQLHKRFGFVQEGYFRQHIFKGGKPMDVVFLAILNQEWESKKADIEANLGERGILVTMGG